MRSKIVMLLLLLILIFIGTEAQNRGPRYENRTLHKEKKGLKKHDYTPVTVDMSYPYFTGKDSDAKFLNAEVSKYLFEKHKTFDKFCSAFFQEHSSEAPETMSNWLVEKNISVLFSSTRIVSFSRSHVMQAGHNAFLGTSQPVSYDLKSKKILTLQSVFKGSYKPELTRLVWQELKKQRTEDGRTYGYYDKLVGKYLSDTYFFTGSAIVFSFDWGEIAPRIHPGFEAEVPYRSIKSYIRKDSAIWDLVK